VIVPNARAHGGAALMCRWRARTAEADPPVLRCLAVQGGGSQPGPTVYLPRVDPALADALRKGADSIASLLDGQPG
jgi:hypothetical protein